jgi:hypothetical protein
MESKLVQAEPLVTVTMTSIEARNLYIKLANTPIVHHPAVTPLVDALYRVIR